jgi:hypothetical protein
MPPAQGEKNQDIIVLTGIEYGRKSLMVRRNADKHLTSQVPLCKSLTSLTAPSMPPTRGKINKQNANR